MKGAIDRRQFLQQLLGGTLLATSPSLFAQTLSKQADLKLLEGWFSAQGSQADSYGFAANVDLQVDGAKQSKHIAGLSGFRGHGGAQHPNIVQKPHSVLMFGRRPSNESIEVDLFTGEVMARFRAQPNRHFFGHGAFSADGKTLFTVEADVIKGVGVIGIRDADSYQWLGEYSSYGVGPHQMMLMPNGRELVVANGGILTRPESGREKLNLATMRSTLTYIDVETGKMASEWQVPEPKASIRHLDVIEDGTVAIAMQVQRDACGHETLVPLTAIHKPGQAIQLLDQPDILIEQMADYVGSVAIHAESRTAGFTSPRGDVVGFWDIDSGDFKGYHGLRDVCGIAVSKQDSAFIITNSYGMVQTIDANSLQERVALRRHYPDMAWDNHMVTLV